MNAPPDAPPPTTELDLTPAVAAANRFRRRRRAAYSLPLLVGPACGVAILLLGISVGGEFLVLTLFLALVLFGWLPTSIIVGILRFWSEPPRQVSVSAEGLRFARYPGGEVVVPWSAFPGRLEIVRTSSAAGAAPAPVIMLSYPAAPGARALLFFRRALPCVYLTEDALGAILDGAVRAHVLQAINRQPGIMNAQGTSYTFG